MEERKYELRFYDRSEDGLDLGVALVSMWTGKTNTNMPDLEKPYNTTNTRTKYPLLEEKEIQDLTNNERAVLMQIFDLSNGHE